jgi:mono/diheme cytochrome c family protein
MELGLQNAGHAQADDPLNPRRHLAGNDLSQAHCDALLAFVAALPAPSRLPAAGRLEAELLNEGERLFESTGCSACHVRDVGNVRGIYSDLLLHDMGPALEDPLPAFPDHIKVGTRSTGSSGYGGGSVDIFADIPSNIRREWKTPPLWGVRDSAPYLHDGRARTLAEAIVAHGGQAESSVNNFKGLDYLSRTRLIAFLNSLGAPGSQAVLPLATISDAGPSFGGRQ